VMSWDLKTLLAEADRPISRNALASCSEAKPATNRTLARSG